MSNGSIQHEKLDNDGFNLHLAWKKKIRVHLDFLDSVDFKFSELF
jgi:hypothetical protein